MSQEDAAVESAETPPAEQTMSEEVRSQAKYSAEDGAKEEEAEIDDQDSKEDAGFPMRGGDNSRNIPAVDYIENPYKVVYSSSVDKVLQQMKNELGKYRLMENQLVKQKVNVGDQKSEMQKNLQCIDRLRQLKEKEENMMTQFRLTDQMLGQADVDASQDVIAIWLGANVMLEFTYDEGYDFLKERLANVQKTLDTLQADLDFCRKQINILEVNQSRVHNANVKVKEARAAAEQQ